MSNSLDIHESDLANDAKSKILKQARQLAYDTKYKVKQSLGSQTNLSPAQVSKAYVTQLAKSPAPPAIKAQAKQILMNGDHLEDLPKLVEKTVLNALYKVFVEGVKTVEEEVVDIEEESGERKYQVRVRDKETGNSYVTNATRAKIRELRANPNISSVEMTNYGDPIKSEREKGEQTASVKAGKGLDPVGQEDADPNNNGIKNDPSDKYLLNRRKVRGAAIAKKKGGVSEEFLGEVKKKTDENKVKEGGVNNYKNGSVKLFPELSEQSPTMINPEVNKAKTTQTPDANQKRQSQVNDRIRQKEIEITQKKLSALRSAPRGSDPSIMASYEPEGEDIQEVSPPGMEGTVKAMKKHNEIDNPYALAWWMKNKGYKSHRKSTGGVKEECDCDEQPKIKKGEGGSEDPREIPTKVNLVKNKLRSMGLKMSYEPEGEMVDEATAAARRGLPDTHRPRREARASAAAASLSAVAKGEKRKQKYAPGSTADTVEKTAHKKNFPGSRQTPTVRGAKETSSQTQSRLATRHNERVAKHGFTKKEKGEDVARRPYDSSRD